MNLLFKNVILVAFNGVGNLFLCVKSKRKKFNEKKEKEANRKRGRGGKKCRKEYFGSLLSNSSVSLRCQNFEMKAS